MSDIRQFPSSEVRHAADRQRLAAWFRQIADYLDANILETEPHAALVVLAGREQYEVVSCGFTKDALGYREAIWAVKQVCDPSYRTVGGNIRKRHTYISTPIGSGHNVIDGAFPSHKQEPSP